jgi:hypothetical protein
MKAGTAWVLSPFHRTHLKCVIVNISGQWRRKAGRILSSASWLATLLDQEMLEVVRGVTIAPRFTSEANLPSKAGREVADELGGRYLMRYLLPHQVGLFTKGHNGRHFVTPTPIGSSDLNSYLTLPAPRRRRPYLLALKPSEINSVLGPRWVSGGRGIEYVLPAGFPQSALVWAWELQVV